VANRRRPSGPSGGARPRRVLTDALIACLKPHVNGCADALCDTCYHVPASWGLEEPGQAGRSGRSAGGGYPRARQGRAGRVPGSDHDRPPRRVCAPPGTRHILDLYQNLRVSWDSQSFAARQPRRCRVEVASGCAHVATFGAGRRGFTVPKDSPIVFLRLPILPILPVLHSSDELAMAWVRGGREIRVSGRVGLGKCWVTPDLCESDIPAT